MGQKVNPIGIRLGINRTWKSKWYVDPREYADTLHEDLKLREEMMKAPETKGAEISDIEIIRQPQRITLVVKTSRPGIIIGAKGSNIEKIGARLQKTANKKIQIKLKTRGSFRRTLKMAVSNAMKAGVQGVKIRISGRLGGAEMARTEWSKDGRIPLHTLRAGIDYGFAEAVTTFGLIGVKVWVYNGDVYKNDRKDDAGLLVKKTREPAPSRRK